MQTFQLNRRTDAHLLSDYIKGCEKSFELLIHRHKSKIYNFIFSKVLDRDIARSTIRHKAGMGDIFAMSPNFNIAKPLMTIKPRVLAVKEIMENPIKYGYVFDQNDLYDAVP